MDEIKKVVEAIDEAISLVFGEGMPEKTAIVAEKYPNLYC